jgi:hypothetical protein
LTADVPRIGTTPASVSARACYVKPAVPCVSVDPGAAVTVEALFFTSSAFGAPIGYGEAIVASLDPGVAAAMLESSGSGEKAVARIKGIAPGRAEIRIYGGGSLATVEARVGESCP